MVWETGNGTGPAGKTVQTINTMLREG